MTDTPLPPPDATLPASRSLPTVGRSTPASAPASTPAAAPAEDPTASLYERVGGEPFFTELVDAFYARVAEDDVLRPLYPEQDLGPANERLRLFLIQYWGGPSTYSEQRGHPRLRMRHAPYPVGSAQIQAWMTAMRGALDEVAPSPQIDAEIWAYVLKAAPFMRNTDG